MSRVFSVYSTTSSIDGRYPRDASGVHPSIYLKPGTLLSGKGTPEEPYRIIG